MWTWQGVSNSRFAACRRQGANVQLLRSVAALQTAVIGDVLQEPGHLLGRRNLFRRLAARGQAPSNPRAAAGEQLVRRLDGGRRGAAATARSAPASVAAKRPPARRQFAPRPPARHPKAGRPATRRRVHAAEAGIGFLLDRARNRRWAGARPRRPPAAARRADPPCRPAGGRPASTSTSPVLGVLTRATLATQGCWRKGPADSRPPEPSCQARQAGRPGWHRGTPRADVGVDPVRLGGVTMTLSWVTVYRPEAT